MPHKKNRFLFLAITLCFLVVGLASCQKEIHINLPAAPPQLVVEGSIETGLPPYVFLTSTMSFFSKIDLKTLQNSFVHGADVKVSDGTKTITLREYTFDTSGGNQFSLYSIDTAALGNLMVGEVGKSYKLTIVYNGVTYTSTTKIPAPKGVDTLWFADPLFKRPKTPVNALELFANYTDPDTPGNYVRYYTRRNNEIFYPGQLFSDEVVNGKRIPDIGIPAGFQQTDAEVGDSLLYFYTGDTVTLKWCEIDRGVYDFWNTYQFANNALGNPFASPINVQTNITNGALGVWAGYGSVSYTLVVP